MVDVIENQLDLLLYLFSTCIESNIVFVVTSLPKGLPTRCKIPCTVAMDTTPNDFWNILQHLACKILRARLCLHIARRHRNKMPSYNRLPL